MLFLIIYGWFVRGVSRGAARRFQGVFIGSILLFVLFEEFLPLFLLGFCGYMYFSIYVVGQCGRLSYFYFYFQTSYVSGFYLRLVLYARLMCFRVFQRRVFYRASVLAIICVVVDIGVVLLRYR